MSLEQNMLSEPVSSLNLRQAITVPPDTPIVQARDRMIEAGLGCVFVVDDQNRPVGKFTERILIELLAKDPDALTHSVSQYMAQAWDQVRLTDPIIRVLDAMQANNLRFLVVVDEHDKVVGLTGQRGLTEYVADHFPRGVNQQGGTESILTST